MKILDRQAKENVKVEQKRLEKLQEKQEKSEKMLVDPSRLYKTYQSLERMAQRCRIIKFWATASYSTWGYSNLQTKRLEKNMR